MDVIYIIKIPTFNTVVFELVTSSFFFKKIVGMLLRIHTASAYEPAYPRKLSNEAPPEGTPRSLGHMLFQSPI
jgi:hypothetical protein